MTGPAGVATIAARNINHAFPLGIQLLQKRGIERPSRAGPVREVPTPVATTYTSPMERVLFDQERDANPFFHLFEALWMLAGRNDVDFLLQLNKRMAEYSDDGVTQHGAYGFRWREWFGFDQLIEVTDLLKKDHSTRRGVLTMWSAPEDLPLTRGGKDVPCNTNVYFKIRDGRLHMTVCNRSNDVLWGAYGANAVHMSFLQEYVANKVGVEVGPYTQMSDSFHVYTTGPGGELWKRVSAPPAYRSTVVQPCPYVEGAVSPYPLGAVNPLWDADLETFFGRFDNDESPVEGGFETDWWRNVAAPLWRAFKNRDAADADMCIATDWRKAALEWLVRRAAVTVLRRIR